MNNRKAFHSLPDWENPTLTQINRAPAHTRWGAYESESLAAACCYGESKHIRCLDGEYAFKLYDKPSDVDDFYRTDYDTSGFSSIQVPGNWEVQGFGKPIYTNYVMPWRMDLNEHCTIEAKKGAPKLPNPPYVPKTNPTGCYRRYFEADIQGGREMFLRFEGVETAYYLWINGHPVGYNQDSKLPAEFNITEYLVEGKNLMALQVMQFADSSYLEDQDYWYLCGIFRSVYLISKPRLRIEDWQIKAIPDLYRSGGTISADISVSRVAGFADCRIKAAVYDPKGKQIAEAESGIEAIPQYTLIDQPAANAGRVRMDLPDVSLWSTDAPNLYTVTFTLIDGDGMPIDHESSRVGFKKIEVENGVVMLNGKRLIIYGVNRHEHFWRTGRALSREHILAEIKQMKRMNINAIRTSHYPNAPLFYELCDECGILVVCECDLETHGVAGMLSHNPLWAPMFVERAVRMVQNYKNHACIYSWSLGNESGYGANHAAMYGFIKEYDPTRLCQYEAGAPGKNISDVRGNMYAHIDTIMKLLCDPIDDRPIILVEYLYQIRNSGGGMAHFIELIEKYPRFQGGFIWDWQDKSLCGKDDQGNEFFAYGGDFDEDFTETNEPLFMTNNGIVMPDLTWKPVAYEVKQAYCPLQIQKPAAPTAWYTTSGWQEFVAHCNDGDTKNLECTASLRENGIVVKRAQFKLPELTAGESRAFEFEIPHDKKRGCEYTLEFSLTQKHGTRFADAGYELGLFQFVQQSGAPFAKKQIPTAAVALDETDDSYIVSFGDCNATVLKQTGALVALKKGDVNYVQGTSPCLNRPLTGLDARANWGWFAEYAKARSLAMQVLGASTLNGSGGLRIEFDYVLSGDGEGGSGRFSYIFRDDELSIEHDIHLDHGYRAIPRVSMELVVPEGFEALTYYGFGPMENYPDRMLCAQLAVYESTVTDQHFPFAPPSECGGHEGTRRLSLTNAGGAKLTITSETPFHFDAHHSTVDDYIKATHDHKLPRHPETCLHIDVAHGPIGSKMAWSTAMPEQYAVKGGSFHQRFSLTLN